MAASRFTHLIPVEVRDAISIRTVVAADRTSVIQLWMHGLMRLTMFEDSGADLLPMLDNLIKGRGSLWLAESGLNVVGSAALIAADNQTAEMRCLCISPAVEDPRAVARHLMEIAVQRAWEIGCLKLIFRTRLSAEMISTHLHELGFEYSRERDDGTLHLIEFYQNLYQRPRFATEE